MFSYVKTKNLQDQVCYLQQEVAGLNFVFDRLNAFCFISKPNFIIVLHKILQV